MNVVLWNFSIVGSPRKGKAADTLADKALEGVKSKAQDCKVKEMNEYRTRNDG